MRHQKQVAKPLRVRGCKGACQLAGGGLQSIRGVGPAAMYEAEGQGKGEHCKVKTGRDGSLKEVEDGEIQTFTVRYYQAPSLPPTYQKYLHREIIIFFSQYVGIVELLLNFNQ